MKKGSKKQQIWWRWLIGILGGIAVLVLAFAVWLHLSPWPGAMIIRWEFNQGSAKTAEALEKHVPPSVASIENQQYRAGDKDAYADIFYPEGTNGALPAVVWVHGGAWLSGNKDDVDDYMKILAARGFTTVSINYSLAPEKEYPTQIRQVNDALAYLTKNADQLHIDPDKLFLAGDSAGANIAAQVAVVTTNPGHAAEVGLTPALTPGQLNGVLLNCGIYKMEALASPNPSLGKLIGWGDRETVWAYSGTRNFSDPVIKQMSPYYHVTKDFPAAFITGGNADPLTDVQSKSLAEELERLGVPVSALFYPADHQPGLPHEYQFNLDTSEGKQALEQMVTFMQSRSQNRE